MSQQVRNFYETTLIVRENASVTSREVVDECCSIINGLPGGEVRNVEEWGLRDLAYRIKGCRRGFYIMIQFLASPTAIIELERLYRVREFIVRFMTFKISGVSVEPSALMQKAVV